MAIDEARMGLRQYERIDAVKAWVHVPVPPEMFAERMARIRKEEAILKVYGYRPQSVICIIADEILRKAVEIPRMPQVRKKGIKAKSYLKEALIATAKVCEAYRPTEKGSLMSKRS